MEVDPEIACGIVGNIGQLWLHKQFTDLQINIDVYQFNCNRFILCACSKLFRALLQSETSDEAVVRQVNIKGISPRIFQLVLSAIYKGENGLNTKNMIAFWHAVHKLKIPVLVSKCETFVSSHMTRENVLGIYTSALLLESEKIVKMVHEFMAKNFEYFSKCQLFMLLPANVLYHILCSRNLKVVTQDNLAKSILKWVSHEPCGNNLGQSCAGDILEIRDTNIVSDRMLDHSTDVNNGNKGSVEVILQKPLAFSQDSCLQIVAQCHTETSHARKESLGSLLKLCRLSEASRDCLDMLADTDIIMGVKETRDIVKQALEAHSKARESAKNQALLTRRALAAMLSNDERVVVFEKGETILAYSLERNKLFYFLSLQASCTPLQVLNMYTFNNCMFITKDNYGEEMMTVYKFPFSDNCTTFFYNVGSCSAIVRGFCYTFKDNGLYKKRCDSEVWSWFQVADFEKEISCVIVDIFKDNIIFYDNGRIQKTIYCFDTKTARVWNIMSVGKMCNFITFTHNDQLYVLTNDGLLSNMTTCVNPTNVCYASITDGRVQRNQHQLWYGSYDLIGAVIRADTLVIFANLNFCKTPVVTLRDEIYGVYDIYFVHLNTNNKCYPLTVPSRKLVTEV